MVMTISGQKLKTGEKCPDFALMDVSGKKVRLYSLKAKAIMVTFMCNHCPFVQAKMNEMKRLFEEYGKAGVVCIGICSNETEHYPMDDFEHMKKELEEKKFAHYYLWDETQEVAKAYGAVCTPDPFLMDGKFVLVYHGRFNDSMGPLMKAKNLEMEEAIKAVLAGGKPAKEFVPSLGCSIKWKEG